MEANLGEHLDVVVMSVVGNVGEGVGKKFVEDLVEAIGMTPAPGCSLCRYPVDNKGGNGYTLFQPITESFIAFDSWPDLKGAYLVICSCARFSIRALFDVLEKYNLEGKQFNKIRVKI
jgi:hypothetical protein